MTLLSASPSTARLASLDFANRLQALAGPYYAKVTPTPLPEPHLVSFNEEAARLIDLDPSVARSPEFVAIMAGSKSLPGSQPIATVYSGHQFGVYVPQLGDGRAILIGQVRNRRGELWELQLKGAGKTPYSRFADGRAVLRSTIREYLAGEAMHHLGIPTTRGLCVVGSPEPVYRESEETAAVLTRMAPTHLRFGHFEFYYYRKDHERLAPLADHVIDEYFPELSGKADRYQRWLIEVTQRTARLISQWMGVGFCHGVMNTDNMSIVGLTMDYGPYGFMDAFKSGHVCNHSDDAGRYAYNQQPVIGHWNVSRLVQACLPLLHKDPQAALGIGEEILDHFPDVYTRTMLAGWRQKLGLVTTQEGDQALVLAFLKVLDDSSADFTRAFRHLSLFRRGEDAAPPRLRDEILDTAALDRWAHDYLARLRGESREDAERAAAMNACNPKYILRNHLAQRAITKAQAGDFNEVDRLLAVLRRPYDEQPENEVYASEPPEEERDLSLSCSS